MKNKKVWITAIFAVVCAAVILTVILVANYRRTESGIPGAPDSDSPFATLEEAVEAAGFPLQCTDRLNGVQATEYYADETVIIAVYGHSGRITKTLIREETSDAVPAGTEDSAGFERVINDMTVRFTGEESKVRRAEWTYNGFDYVITLTENSTTADTMTDYINATR